MIEDIDVDRELERVVRPRRRLIISSVGESSSRVIASSFRGNGHLCYVFKK